MNLLLHYLIPMMMMIVRAPRIQIRPTQKFFGPFSDQLWRKNQTFSDQITSENIEIRTSSISMYYKKIFFAVCLMEKIFCYALNKGKMPKFRLLKLFQTFFGLTLDEKSEFRPLPKKRTILSALLN